MVNKRWKTYWVVLVGLVFGLYQMGLGPGRFWMTQFFSLKFWACSIASYKFISPNNLTSTLTSSLSPLRNAPSKISYKTSYIGAKRSSKQHLNFPIVSVCQNASNSSYGLPHCHNWNWWKKACFRSIQLVNPLDLRHCSQLSVIPSTQTTIKVSFSWVNQFTM